MFSSLKLEIEIENPQDLPQYRSILSNTRSSQTPCPPTDMAPRIDYSAQVHPISFQPWFGM